MALVFLGGIKAEDKGAPRSGWCRKQVNENTELLVRFRDNILSILQQMDGMQGVMSQMPALPVRLNVDLANNFLPNAGTPPLFMGIPPILAPLPPGQPPAAWPDDCTGPTSRLLDPFRCCWWSHSDALPASVVAFSATPDRNLM